MRAYLLLALALSLFLHGCDGGGDDLASPNSGLTGAAAREAATHGGNAFVIAGGPGEAQVSPGTGQPVSFGPGGGGAGGEGEQVVLTGVEVNPNPATLAVGSTLQLTTAGLTNQTTLVQLPGQTTVTVSYAVTDPGIATVSASGLLAGISPGSTTAIVTVVNGGQTLSATVPVQVNAVSAQFIAYLLVSNPTPNGAGGSLTSIGVAPDGGLSVIDNNTNVNRPLAVAVTPSGQFVYTANILGLLDGTQDFSTFSASASTGQLTFVGADLAAQGSPQTLVVDPSGRFVYSGDFSGELWGYVIGTDGRLSLNPAVTVADLGPIALSAPIFNGTGDRMYVPLRDNDSIAILNVDTATGGYNVRNAGVPTGTGSGPAQVVLNPAKTVLYCANSLNDTVTSHLVDGAGDLSPGATVTTADQPRSIQVHPTLPVLYVASAGGQNVASYSIDAAGGMTAIGTPQPTGVNPTVGALVDPSGRFLYITCRGGSVSLISAYSINQTDGSLAFIRDYPFSQLSFASGAVMLRATP